jgi:hypothetical protein
MDTGDIASLLQVVGAPVWAWLACAAAAIVVHVLFPPTDAQLTDWVKNGAPWRGGRIRPVRCAYPPPAPPPAWRERLLQEIAEKTGDAAEPDPGEPASDGP